MKSHPELCFGGMLTKSPKEKFTNAVDMLNYTLRTQLQIFLQEKKINPLSPLRRRDVSTVVCSPPYLFFYFKGDEQRCQGLQ